MGYWDYRIIENEGVFTICEVFYDDNEQPMGFTQIDLGDFDEEELKEELPFIVKAKTRPILTMQDFPKGNVWE